MALSEVRVGEHYWSNQQKSEWSSIVLRNYLTTERDLPLKVNNQTRGMYDHSHYTAPPPTTKKHGSSTHKVHSGLKVLPDKINSLSVHSGTVADKRSSSRSGSSSRSLGTSYDFKHSQSIRASSPSPTRRGVTTPRHHAEASSRLYTKPVTPVLTRANKPLQQKLSPVMPQYNQCPPSYEMPTSVTSYTSSIGESNTRYSLTSDRRPSSPVQQRRGSLDIGDSPARQKRREERGDTTSHLRSDSPSLSSRKRSSSMEATLTANLRSEHKTVSVADCLNFKPVSDSFHHTSDIDKRASSRDWKVMDKEVKRNTLHLDPITNHDRPVSPDVKVATVSSSTSYNRSRYKPSVMTESCVNDNSKLPPIVAPAATLSSKLLEPSLRVKALLSFYIKRKVPEASREKYLEVLEAVYVKGGIAGLPNVGNTCYMNSVLQCLSHTLEMTHFFMTHKFKSGLCSDYKDLLSNIWKKKESHRSSIPPSSMTSRWYAPIPVVSHDAMRSFKRRFSSISTQFMGFAQHDAQEFLLHFISKIHAEIKKLSPAPVTEISKSSHEIGSKIWQRLSQSEESTPISDFFMGEFETCLECNTCRNRTTLHDQYWDIGLPVFEVAPGKTSVSLYKCLSIFQEDELMHGSNSPFCEKCKRLCTSTLRMAIHRLPPILCIYLKRFDWSNPRFPRKLNTPVEIPYQLDLTSCCTAGRDGSRRRNCYDLYGVTNHMGTLFAGHYTACVRHGATQEWFDCNDSHVDISHQMSSSNTTFTSKNAYVLFYRQIEATSPPVSP